MEQEAFPGQHACVSADLTEAGRRPSDARCREPRQNGNAETASFTHYASPPATASATALGCSVCRKWPAPAIVTTGQPAASSRRASPSLT